MTYILPFVLSMVVTMALLPLLVRNSGWLRLVDSPGQRKVHAAPIPRVGGIAMVVGVVAAIPTISFSAYPQTVALLTGGAIIFLFGVLDDRFDIDYRLKFAGQIIGCAVPVLAGHLQVTSLDLPDPVVLQDPVAIGLTFFWMIGVTNAVNLADGLDGLAGGTALLCLLGLAWLSYLTHRPDALALSLALAGAVLGFLRFNTHPATVFMGDAGSQVLGYSIGGLGLLATYGEPKPIGGSIVLLLLGMPLLDTLQVMTRRLLARTSPFRADRGHLHHRLLSLGIGHGGAVMVIYALQCALLVVAYLQRFSNDAVIVATFVGFSAVVLGGLAIAERRSRRRPVEPAADVSEHRASRAQVLIGTHAVRALCGCVAAYLLLVLVDTAFLDVHVGAEVSVPLAVMAATLLTLLLVLRAKPLSTFDKAAIHGSMAAFVLVDLSGDPTRHIPRLDWIAIVAVALATVTALWARPSKRFVVTPLDILVLAITLVLPNLPGLSIYTGIVPLAVVKLVVLFYAVEVLLSTLDVWPLTVRLLGVALVGALTLAAAIL